MIGRTYLERGRPVTVLVRWGPGGGPRNVAVRREDGTVVCRPFRGLRRMPPVTRVTPPRSAERGRAGADHATRARVGHPGASPVHGEREVES